MGGSRFKPWFGLGCYRWILGEFSSGVYPTVSHLLVHCSKFKPVTLGEAPSIWNTAFVLPVQIRILLILKHSYMLFLLIDSPPSLW